MIVSRFRGGKASTSDDTSEPARKRAKLNTEYIDVVGEPATRALVFEGVLSNAELFISVVQALSIVSQYCTLQFAEAGLIVSGSTMYNENELPVQGYTTELLIQRSAWIEYRTTCCVRGQKAHSACVDVRKLLRLLQGGVNLSNIDCIRVWIESGAVGVQVAIEGMYCFLPFEYAEWEVMTCHPMPRLPEMNNATTYDVTFSVGCPEMMGMLRQVEVVGRNACLGLIKREAEWYLELDTPHSHIGRGTGRVQLYVATHRAITGMATLDGREVDCCRNQFCIPRLRTLLAAADCCKQMSISLSPDWPMRFAFEWEGWGYMRVFYPPGVRNACVDCNGIKLSK